MFDMQVLINAWRDFKSDRASAISVGVNSRSVRLLLALNRLSSSAATNKSSSSLSNSNFFFHHLYQTLQMNQDLLQLLHQFQLTLS